MIGIISRTEGEGSGAEIILNHLLNNWNKDIALTVITACDSSVANTAKANGIKVIELSFVAERILPNIKSVEKCIRQLRSLKLIHAWNSKSFELGWYISKRLGIKLTCTMHDHPKSAYFTSKKLWLLKTIANVSSGLVVVSDTLASECKKHNYYCQLTTIHNGLPPHYETKAREKVKRTIVGFLGMNSTIKGFSIIANWIRNTALTTHVQWYLYGEVCAENKEILKQLNDEGLKNYQVLGRQTPDAIFKEIDILVHASTVFDCYPTVLLEAARAGITVVASKNGGASEIVQHEYSGFLFDSHMPESGLRYLSILFNDKELCITQSRNAKEIFDKYLGISQMVEKYSRFWMKKMNLLYKNEHSNTEIQ